MPPIINPESAEGIRLLNPGPDGMVDMLAYDVMLKPYAETFNFSYRVKLPRNESGQRMGVINVPAAAAIDEARKFLSYCLKLSVAEDIAIDGIQYNLCMASGARVYQQVVDILNGDVLSMVVVTGHLIHMKLWPQKGRNPARGLRLFAEKMAAIERITQAGSGSKPQRPDGLIVEDGQHRLKSLDDYARSRKH